MIIMMSAEGVCYRICQAEVHPLAAMGLLWSLEKGYYAAHVLLLLLLLLLLNQPRDE
jgi:hypothetical protein